MSSIFQNDIERHLHLARTSFRGRLIIPHQPEGVRWMLQRELATDGSAVKGGILADEPGLGKTATAIACCLGNRQEKSTLILCKNSLVSQWEKEVLCFSGSQPMVLDTKSIKTISNATTQLGAYLFVIAPFSLISIHMPNHPLFQKIFARVIVDEAHETKNTRSQVYRNLMKIMRQAEIRWLLTGTPVTRAKTDFTDLMRLVVIQRDTDCQESYDSMRQKYCLRRTFEDLTAMNQRLRLPPLDIILHCVPFATEEERELYNDLKQEGIDALYGDKENASSTMMEIILRLRQSTVCPRLVYDGRDVSRDDLKDSLKTTKIMEVLKLLESTRATQTKCLIFCQWILEMETIAHHLRLSGFIVGLFNGKMNPDSRARVLEEFSDGNVQILILQTDCGSAGLNLQKAELIFINSPPWNATTELQAIARAHRIGVSHTVRVYRLVIKGTIDEYIQALQNAKLGFAAEALSDNRITNRLGGSETMNLTLKDFKKIFQ
jgi:SNF2 family DNA or RNA helicase